MGKQVTVKVVGKIEDFTDKQPPRKVMQVIRADTGEKIEEVTMWDSKKGVTAIVGKSYTGYLNPPKENYKLPSFSICWQESSQPTQEPEEMHEEPINEEASETEAEYQNRMDKLPVNEPPTTPPEPETPKEPKPQPNPGNLDLRLRVADIEARRENRLTRNIPLSEFIVNCQRIIKYVKTGE